MNTLWTKIREQLLEDLKEGKEVLIPVKGVSMEPTLYEGDVLYVSHQPDYEVGDIIVFSYRSEGYLVHRLIGIDRGAFLCKGDNARRVEVILKRQIIGKVMRVIRKEAEHES